MDEKTALKLKDLIGSLIADIDALNLLFRRQSYFEGLRKVKKVLNDFQEAAGLLCQHTGWLNREKEVFDPGMAAAAITSLFKAQQDEDYILMADLYEAELLPFLLGIQAYLIGQFDFLCDDEKFERTKKLLDEKCSLAVGRDVFEIFKNGFAIEHTADGNFTLCFERENRKQYLSSNNRVYIEARHLAEEWHEESIGEYVVYGLGLGYQIKVLLEISAYAPVKIYESSMNVILAASAFGVLEELLLDERVEFFYDPKFEEMERYLSKMPENSRFFVHAPSLCVIEDVTKKERLEEYFIQYSSYQTQKKYLDANFVKNTVHYDAPVDELRDTFAGKDIYIIAGGPSLDKNVEELRGLDDVKDNCTGVQQLRKKSVIICVGTVYAKLLKAGIRPDYVIATDAKPNTFVQISGLLEEKIPLLGLSTLYYKFFEQYSGKKYIICQKDYDKSEEFSKQNNWMLFETGGSVVTAALDVALQFSPARVVFAGLDLAYTDGLRYAQGTAGSQVVDDTNVLYTEDVFGGSVATGKNLNLYRRWIERRIVREGHVKVIDATEGGALIQGTQRMTLKEAVCG